jgi:diguanylate cyclase (GGDEF)-like protein
MNSMQKNNLTTNQNSGDVLKQLTFVSGALRAANSKKDVLDFVIRIFLKLGFERVRIWLIDLERGKKMGGKSSYIPDKKFRAVEVRLSKQDSKNLPLDYLRIIKKKKPFVNRTFPVLKNYFGENKMKYSVEFPLFAGNQPLGLISVDNAITNKPIDLKRAETTLMPLANHIALVLFRVIAKEKINQANIILKKRVSEATIELRQRNTTLDHLAHHDDLSGLPNRRHFEKMLKQEFARATEKKVLTLGMLDIDFLKHVNDAHGHSAGDNLIKKIGNILSAEKEISLAARFAGDEFVFLIHQKSCVQGQKIFKRIIKKIKRTTKQTVSIGGMVYPDHRVKKPIDLIRIADDALYHAKHTGRNRFVCACEQNGEKILSLTQRRHDLQKIEKQGTFAVDYIRQLDAINKVSEHIRTAPNEKSMLQKIAKSFQEKLNFKIVGVFLKDPKDKLKLVAHSGVQKKELIRIASNPSSVPRLHRHLREAMQKRKVIQLSEKEIVPQFVKDFGIRSGLIIPLIGRQHVLGAIAVQYEVDRVFRESDFDFFLTLGDQIESGIVKARAIEQTASFNRQLKKEVAAAVKKSNAYAHSLENQIQDNDDLRKKEQLIHFELISALVTSLEEKDIYTRGHSVRVASYAVRLGRELAMDEDQCTNLRYAGLLHDVGKVTIDQSILHKRTALTESEAKELEQHPTISQKIVSGVRFLRPTANIIQHHHERWDGTGYPAHLQGKQIPLESRIIAIVDAYDAMVTRRSYGHKMSKVEAIHELESGSKKQFDPKLTKIFVKLLKQGKVRTPKSKFTKKS